MDFVSPLYQTLQSQATLDHTKASTQDTQALAQMRMLGVQLQAAQAARDEALRQKMMQGGGFTNPTADPTAPAPNGNPAPQPTTLLGIDYNPQDPLVQSLRNAQQGVNLAAQRVQMSKEVGDIKGFNDASNHWDDQQKEYRLAQKDVLAESERRVKEAAQAFGSVSTPEELKSALMYVNDNVSKKQAQKIAMQLQKTLPDLDNATPDQIQAAVDPVRNRFASMGDQYRFQGSMQASTDRAATLEQRKKEANDKAAKAQAGINTVDLSEGAINDAADVYNSTGKLPPMYRDADSRKLILNAANERRSADTSLPATQADFKSNAVALNSLTKDIATIRPYKDMLDTNAEILKTLAKDAIKTDAALVNKPINWIEQNMAGDPKTAEFLAQMHFVQSEAARVIQNPRLVGPMTDTAKQELNAVINGNMSLGQVESVINRIQSDGQNRVAAMEKERNSLVSAMKGGKSAPAATAPATTASATPAAGTAPAAAIEFLKSNPALKDQFKAKYGYLPPGM